MEQLIEKAKALGIENAEALKEKELIKAIKTAEKLAEEREQLILKAVDFGISHEDLEGDSNEDIKLALDALEVEKRTEDNTNHILAKLGIEDLSEVSIEDIDKAFKSLIMVKVEDPKAAPSQKFRKPFVVNGEEYVFTEKAPESFRFADKVLTQKEWVKDTDVLEIMIEGGLSYIKKNQ